MDFTALDLRIGTVTEALPAGDALRLTIRLGPNTTREAETRVNETYAAADLVGRQVVTITDRTGATVVLAAVSPSQGAVLLQPDRPVADGTQVV